MIYFIQSGADGPIKIGVADDPEHRIRNLQTGSPAPLFLRATMDGGLAEERAIHARFMEHRAFGEWFNAVPSLLEFVASAATPWIKPVVVVPRVEPDRSDQRVGAKIRRLIIRYAPDRTDAAIAEAAGMNPRSFSRLINHGVPDPRILTIERVLRAIGVTFEEYDLV